MQPHVHSRHPMQPHEAPCAPCSSMHTSDRRATVKRGMVWNAEALSLRMMSSRSSKNSLKGGCSRQRSEQDWVGVKATEGLQQAEAVIRKSRVRKSLKEAAAGMGQHKVRVGLMVASQETSMAKLGW